MFFNFGVRQTKNLLAAEKGLLFLLEVRHFSKGKARNAGYVRCTIVTCDIKFSNRPYLLEVTLFLTTFL